MNEVSMRLPDDYLPYLLVQGDIPKAVLLAKHYQAIAEGKPSIILGWTVLPKAWICLPKPAYT